MTLPSCFTSLDPTRFDLQKDGRDEEGTTIQPATMKAVVTTGNGGYEKLEYCNVPRPVLQEKGVALIKVLAAGVNNTEINTRLGWYSPKVTTGTKQLSVSSTSPSSGNEHEIIPEGGWCSTTPFPLIQGTDCCGEVVEIASSEGDDEKCKPDLNVGDRVLVRPCTRLHGFESLLNIWMASDFDGAFAQYVKVPWSEVFVVDCSWTDVELATIPCAYGTSENMVHRAGVTSSDRVLITGASGGVGSALVQLTKRRGAHVTAITSASKVSKVQDLGADVVLTRDADFLAILGEKSINVVIDNVGGEGFTDLLKVMAVGGRYASSGAIAGPMVTMDMRDFYLKDLKLIGCTAWDEPVFPNLISYIERGEIRPLVDQSFPLRDIAVAQEEFMKKKHFGKFVLVPEHDP